MLLVSGLLSCAQAEEPRPSGDSEIGAQALGSRIVIKTTQRLAGAIDSITWNGREFVDSFDHGRQLQSASNFDAGTPIANETYNPTEAGSQKDGPVSSSVLRSLKAGGNQVETLTQMAFWLKPGDKSSGKSAKNTTILSNHLLRKKVVIGTADGPNVIHYAVAYTLPLDEKHTHAVFESLTGYMPAAFSEFWRYDAKSRSLLPLSDGPGEQEMPLVFASKDGHYAMGIYSPDPKARYGRFRFAAEKVVKWNCVFRVRDEQGIKPGDYSYVHFVPLGTLKDVLEAMQRLVK